MRRYVWPLLGLAIGVLAPRSVMARTVQLPALTVHINDLRPGYVQVVNQSFTPSAAQRRARVAGRLLLAHGWLGGYELLYRRSDNLRVQVGELADRFRDGIGAHWWYEASVAAVPAGYHAIQLPGVGQESAAVQSSAWTGIIFHRGSSVVDVYVSSAAPTPPLSVLAIARLLDRRMAMNVPAPRLDTNARSARTVSVAARITPNPFSDDGSPTLLARTLPGAICTARVSYAGNRLSKAISGSPRRAGADGTVRWRWHEEIHASSGTALVTCSLGGRAASATARFRVVP